MASSNHIFLEEKLGMKTSQGLRWVAEKERYGERKEDAPVYLALEEAERFKASAVYFRFFNNNTQPPRPQVYIYEFSEIDTNQPKGAEIHRRLWNAGVVPYCFIFCASQILVYNCGAKPEWDQNGFTTKPHDKIKLLSEIQEEIRKTNQYHARQFDSGLFWDSKVSKNFKHEQSAYQQLLKQLQNVKKRIIKDVGSEKAGLVKRILMMLILIKYLEERKDENGKGALDPEAFYKQYNAENPTLEGVLENADTLIKVLAALNSKDHFNGQIFYINDNEHATLKQINLESFRRFVAGDTDFFESNQHGLGQMTLWRLYQFNYLPIELISHIYEDFLTDKKEKGAVYTPPYLVQFLLDRAMPLDEPKTEFKVLDPACGSGIFLVGAFKRMIQWWRVRNNWAKPASENINELKELLKTNIYGCDLEEEAVTLTYFSLSLALLDALSPKEIWGNVHFDNLVKKNLFAGDFFKTLYEKKLETNFDLVIGNPPFLEDTKNFTKWAVEVNRLARNKYPECPEVPQKQIALLFLEQSFNLLKQEGHCCLILPSGPVLYNAGAHDFKKYLLQTHCFKAIYDFTPLRAKLFISSSSKAKPPVLAAFAEKKEPDGEAIQHLIFRRTRASGEKIEFEIDHYDMHWVSHRRALNVPRVWQTNFMGGGRLHRLMEKIGELPTLNSHLEEKKAHEWEVGEGWIKGGKSIQRVKDLAKLGARDKRETEEFKQLESQYQANWITGYPVVDTKGFTEEGITKITKCNEKYFSCPRKEKKAIFKPPHLLIKEDATRKNILVQYSDSYLTFKDDIIGIHAPSEYKLALQNLDKYLQNDENVSLLWLLSGKVLTIREGVPLKKDILALPYPAPGFDYIEKILLDDIRTYHADFRKRGEKSRILEKASEEDLEKFGKMYCGLLNSIYDNFKPLKPIKGDVFIAYPFILGNEPEVAIPQTLEAIEEKLRTFMDHQVTYNLWVKRIIRVYEKNLILMYKPNQKRYWLQSIAVRDADDTIYDLYKQGK